MEQKSILTVAELVKILLTLPQDVLVWSEGCDCFGQIDGAVYEESDNTVVITRSN